MTNSFFISVDGSWGAWSIIAGTCVPETGNQERTRSCDSPTAKNGGEECKSGSATGTSPCAGTLQLFWKVLAGALDVVLS